MPRCLCKEIAWDKDTYSIFMLQSFSFPPLFPPPFCYQNSGSWTYKVQRWRNQINPHRLDIVQEDCTQHVEREVKKGRRDPLKSLEPARVFYFFLSLPVQKLLFQRGEKHEKFVKIYFQDSPLPVERRWWWLPNWFQAGWCRGGDCWCPASGASDAAPWWTALKP